MGYSYYFIPKVQLSAERIVEWLRKEVPIELPKRLTLFPMFKDMYGINQDWDTNLAYCAKRHKGKCVGFSYSGGNAMVDTYIAFLRALAIRYGLRTPNAKRATPSPYLWYDGEEKHFIYPLDAGIKHEAYDDYGLPRYRVDIYSVLCRLANPMSRRETRAMFKTLLAKAPDFHVRA